MKDKRPTTAPLVIGIGNRERGDDGCGLAVVERLASLSNHPARTASCSGDAMRLLDQWQGEAHVVLVDMVRNDDWPAGTIKRFDLSHQPLPYDITCSSHGVSVAQVIELARALGELPPHTELLGIVGHNTTLGAQPSAAVAAAAERAAVMLAADSLRLQATAPARGP